MNYLSICPPVDQLFNQMYLVIANINVSIHLLILESNCTHTLYSKNIKDFDAFTNLAAVELEPFAKGPTAS